MFNSAKLIRSDISMTAGTTVLSPSVMHCSLANLGLGQAF